MDDKEIVKACREVLAVAESSTYNNCNTVYFLRHGEIEKTVGAACYSHIREPFISHLSLCIPHYKDARFANNPEEMDRLLSYFNWIIKESPWKGAFLHPRQSHKTYLKDGLAMNTDKCSQYVVGAMSALRASWEYPYFLNAWDKFQELGFSKETSFILANILDKEGKMSCPNTNHATFDIDSLHRDNFLNFKKGIYPSYEKYPPMKENAKGYQGIFFLFKGEGTNLFKEHIRPFCIKEGNGWNSRSLYNFSPEFVKAVKEFVNE